jgi:hypothetical protein
MYFRKFSIGLIVFFLAALVLADGILGFLGDTSLVILQQIQLILDLYLGY